jgi:hypothetical protein
MTTAGFLEIDHRLNDNMHFISTKIHELNDLRQLISSISSYYKEHTHMAREFFGDPETLCLKLSSHVNSIILHESRPLFEGDCELLSDV